MNYDELNRKTRYPSIETYHVLENGKRAGNECRPFDSDQEIVVTEKIDGTNARIIITPEGYLLGGRNTLLYAEGDKIVRDDQHIVEVLREAAVEYSNRIVPHGDVLVVYCEVYGSGINHGGHYQSTGLRSYAVFDAAWYTEGADRAEWLTWDGLCRSPFGIDLVPMVDAVFPGDGTSPEDMAVWLEKALPKSRASIDGGGTLTPEGVVVRTADDHRLRKIRFADYRR